MRFVPIPLTILCLISCCYLTAQNILDISRLSSPIVFDGKLEEEAWNKATPIHFKMQAPKFGQKPSQNPEVFITYDEDYLYFGGRMFLSDISLLRNTTFKRDAFDGTTDYFGLILDTYLDKENAVAFFTTPTGLRWDGVVSNDAQSENSISLDWNTFWDASTSHDEKGWYAEIRLPWSSLRFQDKDGEVVMGMISWWYVAAKNEVDMFPLIPMNWGDNSIWKPSQAQEVRFKNIKSKKPLYLAPYVLGGYQQSYELNDEETDYIKTENPTFEAGLDVKYGITSNLTMDLTINTDFAQVEADDQQVNLTRFSLFFPEKRLFFQERASIFDFNFDGFNRLFYSRKIGINDDGDPVRIYGGARLVGRVGKHDLGFLNMQTAKFGDLNSENFGLLRVRRQVKNSNSYIGAIFTNRMDFKGKFNSSYGFDGIFRVVGDEYFTVKWAQTFQDSLINNLVSLDPARIYLDWERRRYDGLNYKVSFSKTGKDYVPGIGFELRENFISVEPRLAYGWLMKEKSTLLRLQVFMEGFWLQNQESKKVETAVAKAGVEFQTKKGWNCKVNLVQNHEYVPELFELSDDVDVPIGNYDFFQFQGFGTTPFGSLFGGFTELAVGQFYDGSIVSVGLGPRYKASSHLDLDLFYQYNRIKFSERNKLFNAHLFRLKALYMLNTKFSIAAFLQYNSVEEIFAGNIRIRLNPKEGNDLYIVYNDLLNSRREREIPHLPFSSDRTIVVKYTYTFRL